MANTYSISIDNGVVGWVHDVNTDMPFIGGRFQEGPAFSKVKDLFDEEWHLLKVGANEQWKALMLSLDAQDLKIVKPDMSELRFIKPDGKRSTGFTLLHIRGGKAWWRPS